MPSTAWMSGVKCLARPSATIAGNEGAFRAGRVSVEAAPAGHTADAAAKTADADAALSGAARRLARDDRRRRWRPQLVMAARPAPILWVNLEYFRTEVGASPLFCSLRVQSVERMKNEFITAITALAAEKNLPKEVVLEAVEAALASAYKKDNLAQANVVVKIDGEDGSIRVFTPKTVVEEVEDDKIEMTLEEARAYQARREGRRRARRSRRRRRTPAASPRRRRSRSCCSACARPSARSCSRSTPARKATSSPASSSASKAATSSSTSARPRRVLPPPEQVRTEHYRPGQRLKVYCSKCTRRRRARRSSSRARTRTCCERLFELEVPEIFTRHRRDQVDRARGRLPLEGRRLLAAGRRRPGRRLRRPARHPHPEHRQRAQRRAHRRRAVGPGAVALRRERAEPGAGRQRRERTTRRTRPKSSCRTGSSRSPSARKARTPASPPSSPAGASTSRARRRTRRNSPRKGITLEQVQRRGARSGARAREGDRRRAAGGAEEARGSAAATQRRSRPEEEIALEYAAKEAGRSAVEEPTGAGRDRRRACRRPLLRPPAHPGARRSGSPRSWCGRRWRRSRASPATRSAAARPDRRRDEPKRPRAAAASKKKGGARRIVLPEDEEDDLEDDTDYSDLIR